MNHLIKILPESILQVPLQNFGKDFTFIINSEKFETNSIIASLLSPLISKSLITDPTLSEFTLNTTAKGDFQKVLNLVNFNEEAITDDNLAFIMEIFEHLGTEKFNFSIKGENEKLTIDNVFTLIKSHKKYPQFYQNQYNAEIEFFSENFTSLKGKFIEFILDESIEDKDIIIEDILTNSKLCIENEDELLDVINQLYLHDNKYSQLYEYVLFSNISTMKMKEFASIFDFNYLTKSTWNSILSRLEKEIINKIENDKRYKKSNELKVFVEIELKENQFDGLINHLQMNNNIKNEVRITCSSTTGYDPFNLFQYDDKKNWFETKDLENSWICFEFKNHQIIPSNYIIRSFHIKDYKYLKSWKFEGSNDKKTWITLDSQENNDSLNGANKVHSFPISYKKNENKVQPFKYLRILQTGVNSSSTNHLLMNSIEFYGKLI